MELYASVSYKLSRVLTLRYSTSFGKSSGLFASHIRPHIFAIYGLVRIADEIVDTYRGKNTRKFLDNLEADVYSAVESHYSANPIVHAFAQTVYAYAIEKELIMAFFESMRTDITKKSFNQEEYERYIYGSAEVIGLMCLRVFVEGNEGDYKALKKGAQALGAAYQKVNFLRDIASDYKERGRLYFPSVTFGAFNEKTKMAILQDIHRDFEEARPYIAQLPTTAQKAVSLSFRYYEALLKKLEKTPAETIKSNRIRVGGAKKFFIGLKATGIQL